MRPASPADSERDASHPRSGEQHGAVLALSPHAAITTARTAGVRLFQRCPPTHSVLLGSCRLSHAGRVQATRAISLPAGAPHTVLAFQHESASVAYLDPRRYSYEDAVFLAQRWRGFVPGRDNVRELLGDALARPRRRIDARLLRALEVLESSSADVPSAARAAGLSESRLTHLISDTLGTPPRTWRAWFKLRHAIGHITFGGDNLTQAAHRAGFVDSAHLTRTCKQLMGVAPARVLPRTVYTFTEAL